MDRERELLTKARAAIMAVYTAFGRPGEYGYGSPEGKALVALYDLNNEIADELATTDPLKRSPDLLAALEALLSAQPNFMAKSVEVADARAALAKAGVA